MTAIDRFKELLNTATPEARELVEAYKSAQDCWVPFSTAYAFHPIAVMRSTPQAAEPVSVVRSETVMRLIAAASLMRIQVKERATFLTRTTDWERLEDAMKKAEFELRVTKIEVEK